MKAVRIFNNNAVSAVGPDGREAVLIGPGIGFHKRPGEELDEQKIEKIFYIQNDLQTKFLQLLKDARPEALKAAEDILNHARRQGMELKNQLILSLTDHISFAIERYEEGIELPYLMESETQMLYPKEYEIGKWALKRINKLSGCCLPEYEAGYIALQLASSSMNRDNVYRTLKLVKGSMEIVKEVYGVDLDPTNIDTVRLTTHLKFLAKRIFSETHWTDEGMDGLYELLLTKHDKNEECISRLKAYLQEEFSYSLNLQEEVYLLVHLSKIFGKR